MCSCTGSTNLVEERQVPPRPTTAKLTRSQGSTQYDEVKCGLQDAVGNLWFGTTGEGVYRYDGKGFSQFTAKDGLSNNTVWSILEDNKGRIWFGTDSGLSRWDGKSIACISLSPGRENTHSPDNALPAELAVWSLRQDRHGTIWIGTGSGMLCLKDGVLSNFLEDPKLKNPSRLTLKMVEAIHEDRKGNIWFASGMPPGEEGLCRFDGTTLAQFKPGDQRWIRTVLEKRDGVLWLGTRSLGTWKYDGKSFSQFSKEPNLGVPVLSIGRATSGSRAKNPKTALTATRGYGATTERTSETIQRKTAWVSFMFGAWSKTERATSGSARGIWGCTGSTGSHSRPFQIREQHGMRTEHGDQVLD